MSAIEELLALQIRAEKLPAPQRELRPLQGRKFRLDFAWPAIQLAVEVDGEVHRIKTRFHADLEKHALLLFDGWTLLRVGGREVRSGEALKWIKKAFDVAESRTYLANRTTPA